MGRKKNKFNRHVAVIGFACRFPGAHNADQFWENLKNGIDSITEVPSSRWDIDAYYSQNKDNDLTIATRYGGFIDNIDLFDATYFNVSDKRAMLMDPRQRIMLEIAAETFNHAGYTPKEMDETQTGVYIAAGDGDYEIDPLFLSEDNAHILYKSSLVNQRYGFIGNIANLISSSISYYFNLKGANYILSSACSSSLVAVHIACQNILLGEIDLALAGGIQLYNSPKSFIGTSKTGMLAPDGKCKTFSKNADGYILSEGAGAILLKSLDHALRDHDTIYAVIRSSAVNSDGKSMSVLMPNIHAQEAVISQTLKKGRIKASSIGYVEANGTANTMGDSIEFKALAEAFHRTTAEKNYCALGSVEPNIGHAVMAAGMASLMKVIISLQHKKIPPELYLDELNPKIDLENSPFFINQELIDWQPIDDCRRAGINSFGFGGTNCHLILEELAETDYPGYAPARKPLPPLVFNKRRYWLDAAEESAVTSTIKPAKVSQKREKASATVFDDRLQNNIINYLQQLIAKYLSVERNQIDEDTAFFDMGIESVTLVKILSAITDDLKTEISPAVFYECRNIKELAVFFEKKYTTAFGSLLEIAPESLQVIEQQRPSGNVPSLTKATEDVPDYHEEDMAIVGMSGYFPGSNDLAEFWQNIRAGKLLTGEVPENRQEWKNVAATCTLGEKKMNRWGGFLEDIAAFDAPFFNISPREAALMDPRQRLFLETVWKTIEDAGYRASHLAGAKVGVFVGVGSADYSMVHDQSGFTTDAHGLTGLSLSMTANRISYYFDFSGPSEVIDTACSSSLVAIHRAVAALERGDCDVAIAGGVNSLISPKSFILANEIGMLASDGKCKTFDKDADGYVRGEGSAAIMIKPLQHAHANNDHVYAVIRSTAENHGGRAQSLTAPNPKAQTELLQHAYQKAKIDPRTISYIEAHGTGTSLGDPIEIESLKNAFTSLYQSWGIETPAATHCGIGSVKTNIGHLETAAGIAGVIKVLLALKYSYLPGLANFKECNPYIQLDNSPFFLVTEPTAWDPLHDAEGKVLPRRAGVSAFGFGGTNAHVVLEEYFPPKNTTDNVSQPEDDTQIFVLSAKDEERLHASARSMLSFLEQSNTGDQEEMSMMNMAYTLQIGREAMPARLAVIASDFLQLREGLSFYLEGHPDQQRVMTGIVREGQDTNRLLMDGKEGEDYLAALLQEKKYAKIAMLWTGGVEVDWSLCYHASQPCRVPLPTYPFARKHYWIKADPVRGKRAGESGGTKLHPLVGCNTSNFEEISFQTLCTGDEVYMTDYTLQGKATLSSAACLEMAYAAARMAGMQHLQSLQDIRWSRRTMVFHEGHHLYLSLYPVQQQVARFEIGTENSAQQRHVCCQGLVHANSNSQRVLQNVPECIEIEKKQAQCSKQMSKEECYACLKEMHLEYGPAYQSIDRIYYNDTGAIARLVLPDQVRNPAAPCYLHPALLEGAIQSAICLMRRKEKGVSFYYKIEAIGALDLKQELAEQGYACIHVAVSGSELSEHKCNIQLVDKEGKLLLQLRNVVFKKYPYKEQSQHEKQTVPLLDALHDLYDGRLAIDQVCQMLEGIHE